MNQQRSRRFRSAQEAKEKEEARKESIAIWECTYHYRFLKLLCIVEMSKHTANPFQFAYSHGSNRH